jgi:hypothetical protein
MTTRRRTGTLSLSVRRTLSNRRIRLVLTLMLGLALHGLPHAGGLADLLSHASPVLLLLVPLLLGRYPGERLIARAVASRRPRVHRAGHPSPRGRPLFLRRRAAVMAEYLATRPPPIRVGAPAA